MEKLDTDTKNKLKFMKHLKKQYAETEANLPAKVLKKHIKHKHHHHKSHHFVTINGEDIALAAVVICVAIFAPHYLGWALLVAFLAWS